MELTLVILFSLATLFTWVWCFVIGFRTNVVWGVLIFLFHPIATVIYSIPYWYNIKKAFLFSLISIVGLLWVVSVDFSPANEPVQEAERPATEIEKAKQAGEAIMVQMEKMHSAGLISDEEMTQLRNEYNAQLEKYQTHRSTELPVKAESGAEPPPENSVDSTETPATDNPVPPPPQETPRAESTSAETKTPVNEEKLVPKDQAENYIGREITITDLNGRERSGILNDVRDRSLVIERRQRTGSMIFLISISEVKTLKVK